MRFALWMLVWIACWAGLPARAQPPEPDVIVGRADADASGAWPVLLWVRDGAQGRVVVRAPRAWLGALPWRAADAQALMHLERFTAPRLFQWLDVDPCPTALAWGQVIHGPGSAHWPGENEALAHPTCAAGDCAGEVWQLDLPEEAGASLPLARLLPGIAADRQQWLVLLVASPAQTLTLEGLPQLRVPAPLRWDRPMKAWGKDVLPAQAAALFPAIHAAMLEQLAEQQGLGPSSVLMRSDPVASVEPRRYLRSWEPSPEQRQALGLASKTVQGHSLSRLLLRLQPGDRPAELRLKAVVDWQSAELMDRMDALEPRPVDRQACSRKLAAMDCQAACSEKMVSLPKELRRSFLADKVVEAVPAEARPAACLKSCERQRAALVSSLDSRLEAVAQRQREAWAWVEALTGRSAVDWGER